jgi:hypothetical protein
MELLFNLNTDGGQERGYEVANRLRDPAASIHMQVEGFTLRVVLNHPEGIDLNEFCSDIEARITPDPDGLEFSE